MSPTVHPTQAQVVDYFAACAVASRVENQWQADSLAALIDAVKDAPADADVTPLVHQAHTTGGDFWWMMERANAHPSFTTGQPLLPDPALEALRWISAELLFQHMGTEFDRYTDEQVAKIQAMDSMQVHDLTIRVKDKITAYETGAAELRELLQKVLRTMTENAAP